MAVVVINIRRVAVKFHRPLATHAIKRGNNTKKEGRLRRRAEPPSVEGRAAFGGGPSRLRRRAAFGGCFPIADHHFQPARI